MKQDKRDDGMSTKVGGDCNAVYCKLTIRIFMLPRV